MTQRPKLIRKPFNCRLLSLRAKLERENYFVYWVVVEKLFLRFWILFCVFFSLVCSKELQNSPLEGQKCYVKLLNNEAGIVLSTFRSPPALVPDKFLAKRIFHKNSKHILSMFIMRKGPSREKLSQAKQLQRRELLFFMHRFPSPLS